MKNLSIQHRGREALHVIALLTRCLQIKETTAATRKAWEHSLAATRRKLEALYARGLRRDFPQDAPDPTVVDASPERMTPLREDAPGPVLRVWQRELVERLERGLGRALKAGDAPCVAWNLRAETMTVASQPLLDELRAKNLTSNVFRTRVRPAPQKRSP